MAVAFLLLLSRALGLAQNTQQPPAALMGTETVGMSKIEEGDDTTQLSNHSIFTASDSTVAVVVDSAGAAALEVPEEPSLVTALVEDAARLEARITPQGSTLTEDRRLKGLAVVVSVVILLVVICALFQCCLGTTSDKQQHAEETVQHAMEEDMEGLRPRPERRRESHRTHVEGASPRPSPRPSPRAPAKSPRGHLSPGEQSAAHSVVLR